MPSLKRMRRVAGSVPSVLPSLLMCDFGNMESEIRRLEDADAKALHLDVMDGHFVPNLSYGLPFVEAIRKLTELPLDTHLMISNPEKYISRYISAGADLVTIHAEAVDDPVPLLKQIRAEGAAAGLAINPPTSVDSIQGALPDCDLILVMSVMPGFGGQQFDPVALEKLATLRNACPPEVLLEVDGGINDGTIAACAEAGADLFVVGSGIFGHSDYFHRMETLTQLARDKFTPRVQDSGDKS